MSENNNAGASSGKSPEEIAFELVNKLKGQGVWGERNMGDILDMYAECLDAAKGLRTYEGQNRVIAPISNPARRTAAAPVQQTAAAPAQHPAHVQPAHGQNAPVQPVLQQQQTLQQAFKPG